MNARQCCNAELNTSRTPPHLPPTTTYPEYRKYVEAFAADEDLFFKRFSAAYAKLMELGVPAFSGKGGAGGAFDSIKGALGLKK